MLRNHGTKEVYNLHFATEITKADCLELEANLALVTISYIDWATKKSLVYFLDCYMVQSRP